MNCRRATTAALLLLLMLPAPWSHAAKDTLFGVELIARNFPQVSAQDSYDALSLSAQLGGHSCFTLDWSNPTAVSEMAQLVPAMRAFGLKSFIQLGSTFLGDPAPPTGFVKSFADPATRSSFLSAAIQLALTHPDYLVLTTEVNIMYRFNPAEFGNFRSVYRDAYQLVKTISPNTKVGLSYLYTIWFVDRFVNQVDVPALLAPADFVAFTTYPEDLVDDGHFASIADIPADWYGASRSAYPNTPIIFSEVGWSSSGPARTPEQQAEFIRNVPRLMSLVKPELVTWALLYDVAYFQRSLLSPADILFLENLGVDVDRMFEHFNGMGLLDTQGNAKPALNDALQLDFSGP